MGGRANMGYGALVFLLMASVVFAEQYTIKIKTGCVDDAGTNADVKIVLVDKNGNSIEFSDLDNPHHDDFERCNLDTFVRSSSKVIDPCRIILSHNNAGDKPGWYVEYVDVARTNGPSKRFYVSRWLAYDEYPHSTTVDVNYCNNLDLSV